VKITEDPEMGPRRTDYPTACVRIALRDGRALEETVTIVRGDALNPAPAEEVVAKFLALASPVVGPRARAARWTPSTTSAHSTTSATWPALRHRVTRRSDFP
jgi:2-methylcitrate dehydratase PrpD